MEEGREVGRVGPVAVVEAEGRAVALGLHRHPDLAEPVGRQFAGATLVVHPGLEAVEGDLPDHGVQHVLDLQGQHNARSEEHTSELQSLMRISYAVFCLKKKTHVKPTKT